MKANAHNRGSVLMEFILVFPIYLVLFAGTVAIGDRVLHSNRLISADRVAAFDVDGHTADATVNGQALNWSGWPHVFANMFRPGIETDDEGNNQDALTPSTEAHYADATGPWSVCAAATAKDSYRTLAGGTLGQLLALRDWFGGPSGSSGLASSIVDLVSKDTQNGAAFYTLKRRDHYWQRLVRREGDAEFVRADERNWRDRSHISRLLRTQSGRQTENWRLEVANEGWHSDSTIRGTGVNTHGSEAHGSNIPSYERYKTYEELSD